MAKKKSRRKTAKKKRGKRFSPLAVLFKWMLVAGLWAGIFLAGLCAWYAQELPDITKKATFEREIAITVKAANGDVIARYGDIVGETLSTEDFPPHLIYAVLAIEDRRFYHHFGLDPIGLTRAMFVNVKEGSVVQGGSTITQQLAKNLFLSRERTLKRKIQEAMLALWLEYELTKDEILSAYLNRVYMGSGTYGVDAAARLYFEKPVKELSLRQSATLAGLLKAPSRYSPLSNPGLSDQRTDVVINAMVDAGYVKEEEARGMTNLPPSPGQKPSGAGAARYFADWVVDGLQDLIGTPQEDIIVETTLNMDIQTSAQEALLKHLLEHGEERNFSQGAVIVMRPNGAVVAMVGGRDYVLSQFNRAVQAKRQPGSSFKPIVYLTALEKGWRPTDIILDAPFTEGKYRPKNFGHEYYGEVPLEAALMLSLNTAAVRLLMAVGRDEVAETARKLGIISTLDADESLALGSNDVSLLEMSTVYAALANGGRTAFPYAITKIASEEGTLYYQRTRANTMRQVANPVDVHNLSLMMQAVVEHGTGQAARLPYPVSGKTGTSQESRDAWFMGFTNELVAGVWIGNDDNSPMKNVTGGSFPARIWRSVMAQSRGKYAPIGKPSYAASGFRSLIGRLVPMQQPQMQQQSSAGGPYAPERPRPAQRYKNQNKLPESRRYND